MFALGEIQQFRAEESTENTGWWDVTVCVPHLYCEHALWVAVLSIQTTTLNPKL